MKAGQNLKVDLRKDESGTTLWLEGQKGVVQEALKAVKGILDSSSPSAAVSPTNRRDLIRLTTQLFDGCAAKKMDDLKLDVSDSVERR